MNALISQRVRDGAMNHIDKKHRFRCDESMRRVFRSVAIAIASAITMSACGGKAVSSSTPTTQTPAYGVMTPTTTPPSENPTDDRVTPHEGVVLANMQLRVIYVGTPGVDQAPGQDEFFDWLLTSNYWSTVSQYDVGPGVRVDSVMVPTDVFAPASLRDPNDATLIGADDLDTQVRALIHGDGDVAAYPGLAGADAYAIFLPDGLNVLLGYRSNDPKTTCADANGFHAHDGIDPYAIFPPCDDGRSTATLSHEIAEMATDPVSDHGWISDGDTSKSGGEIADLCDESVIVDGWTVNRLWSNSDGQCMPYGD